MSRICIEILGKGQPNQHVECRVLRSKRATEDEEEKSLMRIIQRGVALCTVSNKDTKYKHYVYVISFDLEIYRI